MKRLKRPLVGCALIAGTVVASACSGTATSTPSATATTPSPTSTAVSSTIYGQADPPDAPGQKMTLYSVSIPAGAVIASHQHPGLQISNIRSGVLTYSVENGTVTVVDGLSGTQPGPSKPVAAPATLQLGAGQTLYEPAGMIHSAKNLGGEPVVIELANIVPKEDPLSLPATPTPSTGEAARRN